jgi:hypothetical protein
MNDGTFYGIHGRQYQNFDQAWDDYLVTIHGNDPIDASRYHSERLAFFIGALAAINVESVRINELHGPNLTLQEQMKTAILSTLNEALQKASEEFKIVKSK